MNQPPNENSAELGLGVPKAKDPSAPPVGWYSRGYLPHYNNRETIQSVTFRLADALPQTKLREYWDRYIRDADHFDNVRHYIEQNPVVAGLCDHAKDWPWSSASRER